MKIIPVILSGGSGTRLWPLSRKMFPKQFLSLNDLGYLLVGQKHFLENPGQLSLEFVEIQTGSYLGIDDIVRFEDKYGRA